MEILNRHFKTIILAISCAFYLPPTLSHAQPTIRDENRQMEAVPAVQNLRQPDGTGFQGYFRGTKDFSYYTDVHGVPIAKVKSGEWQWATLRAEKLSPLGVKVIKTKSKEDVMQLIEKAKPSQEISNDRLTSSSKLALESSGNVFSLTIYPGGVLEVDGYTVLIVDNVMHYAHRDHDGILVPSGKLVGNNDPEVAGFKKHLRGKKFDVRNPLTQKQKQQLEELKMQRKTGTKDASLEKRKTPGMLPQPYE